MTLGFLTMIISEYLTSEYAEENKEINTFRRTMAVTAFQLVDR